MTGAISSSGDPYEQYEIVHKRLLEAQKDRDELQRELMRLKDQNDIKKMKNSALGGSGVSGAAGGNGAASSGNGYQLLHVLLVAIISLIVGALIK